MRRWLILVACALLGAGGAVVVGFLFLAFAVAFIPLLNFHPVAVGVTVAALVGGLFGFSYWQDHWG